MNNIAKQADWLPKWLNSSAILEAAQQAAAQKAKVISQNPDAAKAMGEQLLGVGLGGLGLGLAGTRLQHILSAHNNPKMTHTKFGPGPYPVEDDEKIAGLAETLKAMYDGAISLPGKVIQQLPEKVDQNAALHAATLASAGLGVYGGNALMSGILENKRKEELKGDVEDAKKEYQRALISKKYAADMDAAFSTLKTSGIVSTVGSLASALLPSMPSLSDTGKAVFAPLRVNQDIWNAYVTSALGAGALSGKMTYDWTRARSKDKALESARKARARMSGVAPIHIDPEQLAAIKKIAD